MTFYERRGKRQLDEVASAIGLIELAPLFALVAKYCWLTRVQSRRKFAEAFLPDSGD